MSIKQHQLSTLLSAVCSIGIDNIPVAKYRYGSAGSLYPVQVYLHVPEGSVDGLAGGVFYLNPNGSKDGASPLHLINGVNSIEVNGTESEASSQLASDKVTVILVAKDAAMAPIYGALVEPFSAIEAGGIKQLLTQVSHDCQLAVGEICDISAPSHQDLHQYLSQLCDLAAQDAQNQGDTAQMKSRVLCTFCVSESQHNKVSQAKPARIKLLSESES